MRDRHLAALVAAAAVIVPSTATGWKIDPALLQECPILQTAVDIARMEANTSQGVECFVSQGGMPIDNGMEPANFDDDGEGPEIKVREMMGAYGQYNGAVEPGSIYISRQLKLDAQAGDAPSLEVLVAAILHETAHWIDNTVDGVDTPGEEGCATEEWIYGFIKVIENVEGYIPCGDQSGSVSLRVDPGESRFEEGDEIAMDLSVRNESDAELWLLDRMSLEDGLLQISATTSTETRLDYVGMKQKPLFQSSDLIGLNPGAEHRFRLVLNDYFDFNEGSYLIAATYHVPDFGCPLFDQSPFVGTAESEPIEVFVETGCGCSTSSTSRSAWLAAVLVMLLRRKRPAPAATP